METQEEQAREAVQGYVPAIRCKNHQRWFVKIDGKRTKDYMEAYCMESVEAAMEFARAMKDGIYELPGCNPINGACELLPPYEYGA